MRLLKFHPRFRGISRELRQMEARENWPRADIEGLQLERLNDVWSHAITHVPHYRSLCSRLKLPGRFQSLGEFQALVPILPREIVRGNPREFLSEQLERGEWTRTSGSTGTPLQMYWPHSSSVEALRSRYRHQQTFGVDVFDRQAYLWGNGGASTLRWPVSAAANLRLGVQDWLRNRVRMSPLQAGRAEYQRYLRMLARFQPAAIYAYSSAALLLAREAGPGGLRCPSLRVAVLSAEPAPPQLVRTVEGALGVPAVNEYGSIESGPIAFEGPDRTLRIREDSLLVETEPRPDGQHDILVTTLHNQSFPLIRYAIGDLTDGPLMVPQVGFAALRNIVGRVNDLLRTRTGRILHWVQVDAVFEHDETVRRYTVHQQRDGAVSVVVEPTDPQTPPDPQRLAGAIREMLEGYPVQLSVVPLLPSGPNGKHRWITSELSATNLTPAIGLDLDGLYPLNPRKRDARRLCVSTSSS